jgi:hypothetical protein
VIKGAFAMALDESRKVPSGDALLFRIVNLEQWLSLRTRA